MNDNNSGTIRPYKATSNLNTAIGNPSVNINDTMNVNIQNMATNQANINNNQNNMFNKAEPNVANVFSNNTGIPINNTQTFNSGTNNMVNSYNTDNQTNMNLNQNPNSSFVQKTYVSTMNNKSQKKKLSLNIGHEFKIALLITVILLVFVFILPMISDLINQ